MIAFQGLPAKVHTFHIVVGACARRCVSGQLSLSTHPLTCPRGPCHPHTCLTHLCGLSPTAFFLSTPRCAKTPFFLNFDPHPLSDRFISANRAMPQGVEHLGLGPDMFSRERMLIECLPQNSRRENHGFALLCAHRAGKFIQKSWPRCQACKHLPTESSPSGHAEIGRCLPAYMRT